MADSAERQVRKALAHAADMLAAAARATGHDARVRLVRAARVNLDAVLELLKESDAS